MGSRLARLTNAISFERTQFLVSTAAGTAATALQTHAARAAATAQAMQEATTALKAGFARNDSQAHGVAPYRGFLLLAQVTAKDRSRVTSGPPASRYRQFFRQV